MKRHRLLGTTRRTKKNEKQNHIGAKDQTINSIILVATCAQNKNRFFYRLCNRYTNFFYSFIERIQIV